MAFTDTERAQIRNYLGWSARFFQFDSALEQAMNVFTDPGKAEDETEIRNALTECIRIDAAIVTAEARFAADKVGSITLTQGKELELYRSRGRQFSSRISRGLGVEARVDVWAGRLSTLRSTRQGNYRPQG